MDKNATNCLKVAAFDFSPFSSITSDGNVIGPGADLWRYVAIPLKLNLYTPLSCTASNEPFHCRSWTWVLHGFPQFGMKGEDGKWIGIFGYIQNNEVDLLLIDSYVKYDRLEDMEFSAPFTFAYTSILSSALGNCGSTTATSSFPDPSMPVLGALLLTLITVAIFRIVERNLLTKSDVDTLRYFTESFMILIRQPLHKLPSTGASQLVVGFYLLSFIVLINLYLSEMKAEMTLCKTAIPETLEDILKNPLSLPSLPRNLPEFFDMRDSKDSVIRGVWDRVIKNKGILEGDYMSVENVKQYLLVDKRIVIGTNEYMEIKLSEHCQSKESNTRIGPEMKVRLSRGKFFLKPVTFAFRLNMDRTLMQMINNRITLFASTGLWIYTERMKKVILSNCLDAMGQTNLAQDHTTSLSKTFLFTVWGTGTLIALMCLGLEILRYRKLERKKIGKNRLIHVNKPLVVFSRVKDQRAYN